MSFDWLINKLLGIEYRYSSRSGVDGFEESNGGGDIPNFHNFCVMKKIVIQTCSVLIYSFVSSLNRRQLVSTDNSDNVVSYGVRNSIAAYLSLSGNQQPAQMGAESRKKKSKSVYAIPENSLANIDYEDDF